MELTPVDSSHIAAIGYLEADRVLLVRYKDGSLYAFERVVPAAHAALMSSHSKGAFMHTWRDMGVLIAKGGNAENRIEPEQAGAASTTAPLNVIDEDADKCCRKVLAQIFSGPNFDRRMAAECSQCGTRFYPEAIGECVYWRIKSNVVIVRK